MHNNRYVLLSEESLGAALEKFLVLLDSDVERPINSARTLLPRWGVAVALSDNPDSQDA